jgi:hypothetical protein
MSAKSDYLEEKVVRQALGIAAFTMPTDTYVGLFSSDPGDASGGTEASGSPYARQIVNWATTGTNGEYANNAQVLITLPAGTWTHFVIFDALTSGNRLYHGSLVTPVTTSAGSILVVAAGDLVITET